MQLPISFGLLQRIHNLPLSLKISGVAVFLALLVYAALFFPVRAVSFSYAGDTCIKYPLLFPDVYKASDSSDYEVYATDRVTIGSVTLVSASLCFVPVRAPAEGATKLSLAPFGGVFAKKSFSIKTLAPPQVDTSSLEEPLPIAKHLAIDLQSPDKVFTYTLEVNQEMTVCKSAGQQLLCDIKKLGLRQGASYHLKLLRYFKGQQVATVVDQPITTLSATSVIGSTIKPGEQIYAKPKTIEIALDKRLTKADVVLYRHEGSQKVPLTAITSVTDTGIKLEMVDELPRQTDFELLISSVEAADGSGLADPYVIPFKTSGGPKVMGISVGRMGVALGSIATISFDQPLAENQNFGATLGLGGGASFAGVKGSQMYIALKDVSKCGDFSIRINDMLKSNYDIAGGNAWSFTGRMTCYSIETIGYSSRGRPINAYLFGNGPRVVMYTGAIHGNEVGTKYLMDRWIQDLEANARSIPGDKTVVVVPQINPDGVASGSRVNGRNVDLNRNFATSDWQKDITDVNNRPFPGGGGQSPMSEPETRAIAALAQRLRPIMIASYHSIGGVVAGNQAGNSVGMASTYSQLSGYQNVTGSTGETFDYSVTGTADDWYAAQGIPSLLVELSSHSSAQFDRNQKAMWRIVNQ